MRPNRLILILALSVLVAPAVLADQPIERTATLAPDGQIEISIVSGSLAITGWDRDEIHLEGTLGSRVEELRLKVKGDRAVIDLELPDKVRGDVSVELVVQVPTGSSLEIETVSADVEIVGVTGELELASVSGGIRCRGPVAELEVATVSGDIELESTADEIEAASVSGDLDLTAERFVEVELETVSGDIELRGALSPEARIEIESFSGEVTLTVPADTSARWEASSFSGHIRSDFSDASGKSFELETGDGDAEVSLISFSGDILIKKD